MNRYYESLTLDNVQHENNEDLDSMLVRVNVELIYLNIANNSSNNDLIKICIKFKKAVEEEIVNRILLEESNGAF